MKSNLTDREFREAELFTAEHYGLEQQMNILQEECAELIQAISKYRRYGEVQGENLTEEIADVLVMIDQVKILLNISDADILNRKKLKTERQLRRIALEKHNKI